MKRWYRYQDNISPRGIPAVISKEAPNGAEMMIEQISVMVMLLRGLLTISEKLMLILEPTRKKSLIF